MTFGTFFRIALVAVLVLISVYCIYQMYVGRSRRRIRNLLRRRQSRR